MLGGVAAAAVTGTLPGLVPTQPAGGGGGGSAVASTGAGVRTLPAGTSPKVSASASASVPLVVPSPSGAPQARPAVVVPTVYGVCKAVVGGVTSLTASGSGPVAQILAGLHVKAAARGVTVAQLCDSVLHPQSTTGPSASGGPGLGGVLPLPSAIPSLPLPIPLPSITLPPLHLGG